MWRRRHHEQCPSHLHQWRRHPPHRECRTHHFVRRRRAHRRARTRPRSHRNLSARNRRKCSSYSPSQTPFQQAAAEQDLQRWADLGRRDHGAYSHRGDRWDVLPLTPCRWTNRRRYFCRSHPSFVLPMAAPTQGPTGRTIHRPAPRSLSSSVQRNLSRHVGRTRPGPGRPGDVRARGRGTQTCHLSARARMVIEQRSHRPFRADALT